MDSLRLLGVKQIYIPKIPELCPWKMHPNLNSISRRHESWIMKVMQPKNLQQRRYLLGQKLDMLSCMLYPYALHDRLGLLFDYITWFTLFDTDMDDMNGVAADSHASSRIVNAYLDIMEGRSGKTSPGETGLVSAFRTLWYRYQRETNSSQMSRFEMHLHDVLTGQASQSIERENGVLPNVDGLLAQRRVIASFVVGIHLIDFGMGIDLHASLVNDPEIMEFVKITSEFMTGCNDILSFRVEYVAGDFHNLICSMAVMENLNLQEAMLRINDLLRVKVQQLALLKESITGRYHGIPRVKSYLDAIATQAAGNLEWSWRTGRYHGPDWVVPSKREGIMMLEPVDTSAVFII